MKLILSIYFYKFSTKNGWHFHIYLEHNVYHMLYYLIYIKMKPITECNQLEKYIKD